MKKAIPLAMILIFTFTSITLASDTSALIDVKNEGDSTSGNCKDHPEMHITCRPMSKDTDAILIKAGYKWECAYARFKGGIAPPILGFSLEDAIHNA